MTVYTLIHYREDGADYCRGCLMSSSSSDQIIVCTKDINEAAFNLAHIMLDNKNSPRGVCNYETTILVDGWSEGESPLWEDETFVYNEDPWSVVNGLANIEYQKLLKKEEADKLALNLAEENLKRLKAERDAELTVQRERSELARLREKYKEI